jgi:hypothetical protein
MTPKVPRDLDSLLDQAVTAVRQETLSADQVQELSAAAWQQIQQPGACPRIEGCADYQDLFPAYLAGELPAPRRLLVEQHSRECVTCRRVLTAHRTRSTETAGTAPSPPAAGRVRGSWWSPRIALAAAVTAAAVGLGLLWAGGVLHLGPPPVLGQVATIHGELLKVEASGGLVPWQPGQVVAEGERLRTARGSGAVVELADGSRIELGERAELALDRGLSGTTIRLGRGRILVEAAPQRKGRLYVATEDCLVSVKGTVFSVNHGLKGSRVAVLEGEVQVERDGGTDLLRPGQQVTTSASLTPVPLEQEIAWSRNPERYRALLEELAQLKQELDRRLPEQELRFASRLLDLVPAGTVGYLALPNLGESVGEGWEVVQERVASSPVLAQWWAEVVVAHGLEGHLQEMVRRVRDLGHFLGDEVVVALAGGSGPEAPVLLAEATRPHLRAFLETEAERLHHEHGHEVLVLVDDLAQLPAGGEDRLLVWVGSDLVVASPRGDLLAATAAAANGGAPGAFPGTPFHRRLLEAYGRGVELLLAADVAAFEPAQVDPAADESGFADLEHVIFERHTGGDGSQVSALLAFRGPRRGVVSWLAAPGPLGGLEFVSAAAPAVAAFTVREPGTLLREMIEGLGGRGEGLVRGIEDLEQETGIDLRRDLLEALGGEVVFALDGPILPRPSWKAILEVDDPVRLQGVIEALVERARGHIGETGEAVALELSREVAGGRTFHTLAIQGAAGDGVAVHYLFADGYLLAAPSRALLERSLAVARAGTDITTAPRFRELLPADGEAHFSALLFQDLASLAGGAEGAAPPEEIATAQDLLAAARLAPPSLFYAYGRRDAIEIAGSAGQGGLGLGFFGLLSPLLEAAGGHR